MSKVYINFVFALYVRVSTTVHLNFGQYIILQNLATIAQLLLISRQLGDQFAPRRQLRILNRIDNNHSIRRADGRLAADVSNGQLVAAQVLAVLQESFQQWPGARCVIHAIGVQLFGTEVDDRLDDKTEPSEQESGIEMQTSVHLSALNQVLRVQRVVLAVFLHQIRANGVAVVDDGAVVDQQWDRVLRVQLNELFVYFNLFEGE